MLDKNTRLYKLLKKLNFKYEGREVIYASVYGSYNYGTNDETSDFDYKLFVMPTKDDLYNGNKFNSNVKIDGNDLEVHDVRKLVSLWNKANPSYLEVLNSIEFWVNEKYKNFMDKIFDRKKEIATMNLKGYFDAINGVARQKITAIFKDLPNSDNNEGYKRRLKFGFDSKQLLHTIRYIRMRNEVFFNKMNPLDVINLRVEKGNNLFGLKDELLDIKNNVNGHSKESALFIGFNYIISGKHIGDKKDLVPIDKNGFKKTMEIISKNLKIIAKEINYDEIEVNKEVQNWLKETVKELVLNNI